MMYRNIETLYRSNTVILSGIMHIAFIAKIFVPERGGLNLAAQEICAAHKIQKSSKCKYKMCENMLGWAAKPKNCKHKDILVYFVYLLRRTSGTEDL